MDGTTLGTNADISWEQLDAKGPFAHSPAKWTLLEIVSGVALLALFVIASLKLTTSFNDTVFIALASGVGGLVALQKAVALSRAGNSGEKVIQGICLALTLTLTILALVALSHSQVALNPTQLAWTGLSIGGLHTVGSLALVACATGKYEGLLEGLAYSLTLRKLYQSQLPQEQAPQEKRSEIPQGSATSESPIEFKLRCLLEMACASLPSEQHNGKGTNLPQQLTRRNSQ